MRIAVVAGPDPGHAYPALALASALRARAHAVTFVSGDRHRSEAARAGATFVELPALAPTPGDVDLAHRLWRRPVTMAPPLAERLAAWSPDLVVSDVLTRAGAFAAELLGVPWVEISPHHLMDPDPDVPPIGLGRGPARTPWRRVDDRRLRRLQERSVAAGAEQERAARADLGLPPAGGAPVARLLATLPALEPPRRSWPGDAHIVGPLPWEPGGPPLPLPPGDAPLVVVTDSTASGARGSLAAAAATALRRTGLRVVITTGRRLADVGPRTVVGRGPHGPLLDHAAVAVTTGGHGFVGKALLRGVPIVVVPEHGDQRETAGRLRALGAGVWVPAWAAGPAVLRLAVLRAVHDARLRSAAAAVGRSAKGLGPEHAATLLERLVG